MKGYRWRPIEDLPDDWQKFASSELAGLFAVWKEQLGRLNDSPAYQEFQARLRREWAIETGIIEGLYDIDRGVTHTLIERGFHASLIAHGDATKPAEELIPMLKDHETVVEGLFDFVGQQRALSTSYVKQVHQALTAHQETAKGIDALGQSSQIPLLRGDWKKWPNNPTRDNGVFHEYCPPEQAASEMDRLVEMHQGHLQEGVPPEVEAAWLHHRFTQIHPFQDGNGRVARALASLVFLRGGWFPLVVHRDDRSEYIDCLEHADSGDLSALVSLFGRIQKRAFNQAMTVSSSALLSTDSIEQIISAGFRQLKDKEEKARLLAEEQEKLRSRFNEVAETLLNLTRQRLDAIADGFRQKASVINVKNPQSLSVTDSGGVRPLAMSPHSSDRREIAGQLGYEADDWASGWECLLNFEQTEAPQTLPNVSMHVSVHQLMRSDWRIACGLAYIRIQGQPNPLSLSEEPFQCSTEEKIESITARFNSWLEGALTIGLEQWRRLL